MQEIGVLNIVSQACLYTGTSFQVDLLTEINLYRFHIPPNLSETYRMLERIKKNPVHLTEESGERYIRIDEIHYKVVPPVRLSALERLLGPDPFDEPKPLALAQPTPQRLLEPLRRLLGAKPV